MRRSFITLYALAATAFDCRSSTAFLPLNTGKRMIFGQIEWKHPVTVQYSITNTGDRPLVLTEVEPRLCLFRGPMDKDTYRSGSKGNS